MAEKFRSGGVEGMRVCLMHDASGTIVGGPERKEELICRYAVVPSQGPNPLDMYRYASGSSLFRAG
jgi:hypothetical protein